MRDMLISRPLRAIVRWPSPRYAAIAMQIRRDSKLRLFGSKSLVEKLYDRLIEFFWLLDIRKVSTEIQHG